MRVTGENTGIIKVSGDAGPAGKLQKEKGQNDATYWPERNEFSDVTFSWHKFSVRNKQ